MASSDGPRILILGAGFAGVQTALDLARLFPRERDARITLIDQYNFLLFTPMLVEVLAGQVDMLHIVSPTRQIHPRITFEQGHIDHIDLAGKEVSLTTGGADCDAASVRRTLQADHLVIALGSSPEYYGIPGLRSHSLRMKDLCDAVSLRNRTLALFELANAEPDSEVRRAMLSFVVGGGGFSGVETAAALNDLVSGTAGYYPRVNPEDITITLVEALERLLPELSEGLAEYARKRLEQNGIRVMLKTKIAEAGVDFVRLEGRECIPAHTLIWTGGIGPAPIVGELECPHGRNGGVVVDQSCAVPGLPGVWALGDCAQVPQPGNGEPYAPTAQNATRQGKLVARNIHAALNGEPLQQISYKPVGELAALGRRSGVASIYGLHLSGFAAWFLWRTVYLLKLPRFRQRVRVGIDWGLDLLFGREVVQVPTECFISGMPE